MKSALISYLCGILFALGLGISGMTQPQKIIGFLNLLGEWSPELLIVMASAVLVNGVTYLFVRKWRSPILANEWILPKDSLVTAPLVWGSILFGIGWGLAGYCPGPALVSLLGMQTSTFIFVLSMLSGMLLFKIYDATRSNRVHKRAKKNF